MPTKIDTHVHTKKMWKSTVTKCHQILSTIFTEQNKWLLLQRAWFWFPVPTQQLATICNHRRSSTVFQSLCEPGIQVEHRETIRKTYTCACAHMHTHAHIHPRWVSYMTVHVTHVAYTHCVHSIITTLILIHSVYTTLTFTHCTSPKQHTYINTHCVYHIRYTSTHIHTLCTSQRHYTYSVHSYIYCVHHTYTILKLTVYIDHIHTRCINHTYTHSYTYCTHHTYITFTFIQTFYTMYILHPHSCTHIHTQS